MNEFEFEEIGALGALSGLDAHEAPGARLYLARVRWEDASALVAHIALLRRGASRLTAAAFDDLTPELRRLAICHVDEARAQLEGILASAERLNDLAHAIDMLARQAHHDCYAPHFDEMPPDVAPGDTARDEEDPAPREAPAEEAAPVAVSRPKIKVSDECAALRRQFWAVVHKQGLSDTEDKRGARLDAISARIGRTVTSINHMEAAEWTDVISGIEYQSLAW